MLGLSARALGILIEFDKRRVSARSAWHRDPGIPLIDGSSGCSELCPVLSDGIESSRTGNWDAARFERDVHMEILAREGDIDDSPHRFMIPASVLAFNQRDLNAANSSQGGYLVGSEVPGVIDAIRNKSTVLRLGAQRVTGLRGNQKYAVVGNTATVTWKRTSIEPVRIYSRS